MSTSQDHDYLTSLPTELLIKVVAQVPIDSYLDLTHTSKGLRDFMKANAAGVCNEAIRSRHSFVADYLRPELKSGWLVPAHEGFALEEDIYLRIVANVLRTSRYEFYNLFGELFYDANLEELRTTYITVGSPGLQFLHFLERRILHICDKQHLPSSKCRRRPCIQRHRSLYRA